MKKIKYIWVILPFGYSFPTRREAREFKKQYKLIKYCIKKVNEEALDFFSDWD